jgi:pimeloyl-ACP methyl ester carboxylesterase
MAPLDPTALPDVRLLVVPGLGLDARSWAPVVQRLTLRVDVQPLPGYGVPAPRRTDLSPARLGARLGEELRGGRPTVLAGHSSGCQVAAHAARAAGQTVVGLVLVAPTTDRRAAGWPALARRWLRTAAHEDPRQVPGLVRQYRGTGLWSMARAMDAARREDLRATLRGQRLPLLVVRGPADRICPQDWAESLAQRCVTLRSGGHMVPSTHGAEVAEVVTRFLATADLRTSG